MHSIISRPLGFFEKVTGAEHCDIWAWPLGPLWCQAQETQVGPHVGAWSLQLWPGAMVGWVALRVNHTSQEYKLDRGALQTCQLVFLVVGNFRRT